MRPKPRETAAKKTSAPRKRTPPAREEQRPAEAATKRLRRDAPRRTGPIRDASMMFRSPESSAAAAESPGTLEQGVAMAYRVIDDFIQRGRRAASSMSPDMTGTKGREPMQNSPQNMAAMMMAYWMDMGRMWLGLMNPWMSSSPPGGAFGAWPFAPWMPSPPWPTPQGAPPPPWPTTPGPSDTRATSAQRIRTIVDLKTDQAAEVEVTLHPQAGSVKDWRVGPLCGTQGESVPIPPPAIAEEEDGSLRLKIQVSSRQPRGFYTGSIIAADGAPVGTVTVRVLGRDVPGSTQ